MGARVRDSPLSATVSLRDELATLLSELNRLDSVNPPGNETRAAGHLRGYIESNGVACELYARFPSARASSVASLAAATGPGLHTPFGATFEQLCADSNLT